MLFVCTANSARSQLATLLWRALSDVPATSAGTHPAERLTPAPSPQPSATAYDSPIEPAHVDCPTSCGRMIW